MKKFLILFLVGGALFAESVQMKFFKTKKAANGKELNPCVYIGIGNKKTYIVKDQKECFPGLKIDEDNVFLTCEIEKITKDQKDEIYAEGTCTVKK